MFINFNFCFRRFCYVICGPCSGYYCWVKKSFWQVWDFKKRHFYDSIEIEISSINTANNKFASKWSRRPTPVWFEWEIQLLFWFSFILCSTPLEGGIGWWRSMPCREEIEFRNCLFMFCFAWFWNIIKAVSVVWKKEISFCYVMTWSCRKNIQNVKWTFKWVGYSNV